MKSKQDKSSFFHREPQWKMISDQTIPGETRVFKVRIFEPSTTHSGNLNEITLREHTDGSKSIKLTANPESKHKEQFIKALEKNGFNVADPNVTFPSNKRDYFLYRASGYVINLMLPKILQMLKDVEGQNALDSIENNIIDFLQQEPGQTMTKGYGST